MSNIYFKCPNCETVRKIEHWTRYFANCVCTKDKQELDCNQVFLANENLDDLLKLLDRLNIEWGYDEIVWNNGIAKTYDGKDFLTYIAEMINSQMARYGFLKTIEESQHDCEEDFKKRKEINENN